MEIIKRGKILDLVEDSGSTGGGTGLDQGTINIIESNLGTQVETRIGYTEITWNNGLPSLIEKYEDNSKLNKLFTITPTFTDGDLTQVVRVNEDEAITETITITLTNGVPSSVSKEFS